MAKKILKFSFKKYIEEVKEKYSPADVTYHYIFSPLKDYDKKPVIKLEINDPCDRCFISRGKYYVYTFPACEYKRIYIKKEWLV